MGLSKGPEKRGSTVSSTRPEKDQGKSFKKDASTAGKKSDVVESSGQKVNDSHVVGRSSKSEIDEIFCNKKRKVVVAEQDLQAVGAAQKKNKKKKKGADAGKSVPKSSNHPSSDSVTPSSGKPRKKTIDGFKIYSEDEIGFGKKNAGGTPLCPFDCECCF